MNALSLCNPRHCVAVHVIGVHLRVFMYKVLRKNLRRLTHAQYMQAAFPLTPKRPFLRPQNVPKTSNASGPNVS